MMRFDLAFYAFVCMFLGFLSRLFLAGGPAARQRRIVGAPHRAICGPAAAIGRRQT